MFNHYKIYLGKQKETKETSRFSENEQWSFCGIYLPHCTVDISMREAEAELLDPQCIDCRHGSFVIDYFLSSRDPFTFFITQFLHD